MIRLFSLSIALVALAGCSSDPNSKSEYGDESGLPKTPGHTFKKFSMLGVMAFIALKTMKNFVEKIFLMIRGYF